MAVFLGVLMSVCPPFFVPAKIFSSTFELTQKPIHELPKKSREPGDQSDFPQPPSIPFKSFWGLKFQHKLVCTLETQRYSLDSLLGLPGRDGGHFLVDSTSSQASTFGRELTSQMNYYEVRSVCVVVPTHTLPVLHCQVFSRQHSQS